MSNETPLRGHPTRLARGRRRLGGIICRRLGHRPVLVEQHYYVSVGDRKRAARETSASTTFPLLGRRAEERQRTAVICRRCLATCGDTVPEVAR